MIFTSRILFQNKSKRLPVRLNSCVQSGYFYLTRISPLKSKFRMALRKYDPRVDRHVVFYQTTNAGSGSRRTPPSEHSAKYARLTGKAKNIRPLIARIQRAYEYGRYNAFDRAYQRLVDSKGKVTPRMN
ncbi:uncharacterized protein TOT_010000541 [Theileria orientalis strain Shintoku]|uniref:50S ribosomal protein L33 n=1 Tax=Theileria orientalis strain Shintoku TaxID=869250 RepID=J4DNJ7_THEOR|nr:uncharacterized protein TOT_010000541 [Theileria orientalis strain Shintoku]PVC54051.1 hypothetical protein MACL_00003345 [Theileria orientalis]BAM39079.1 uncharacterized protein TOT_010000541 [Theileria orientalis strain Shintoku]|eukprot:XP_009689380.1 uncharacterized protein TOT_010000541 [Theileria orientalis strain Shintoku]